MKAAASPSLSRTHTVVASRTACRAVIKPTAGRGLQNIPRWNAAPPSRSVALRALYNDVPSSLSSSNKSRWTTVAGSVSIFLASLAPVLPSWKGALINCIGGAMVLQNLQEMRLANQAEKGQEAKEEEHQMTVAATTQSQPENVGQVSLQMQAALVEATKIANERMQRSQNLACMVQSLQHSNAQQQLQLRDMRTQLTTLHTRLVKVKRNPQAFDVSHDPSDERAAHEVVKSEVVSQLEAQLRQAQMEATQLRAQVLLERARADACLQGRNSGNESS